jgi:hypothetical protein
MNTPSSELESYAISSRFRQTIEERIARLERDAFADALALATLEHEDHIRRYRRLIAVQRAEASRMRQFLDRARTRSPRPLIAL